MNPFIRMAFRTDACFTALQPVLLPPPKKSFSAQENPLSQKQKKTKHFQNAEGIIWKKNYNFSIKTNIGPNGPW